MLLLIPILPFTPRENDSLIAFSKLDAIWKALRRRWKADIVLVWHVGLLKLIPFFRLPEVKLIVFLHGIEVWKKHDRFTQFILPKVYLFLSNSDYTWQRFLKHAKTYVHLKLT